MQAPSPDADTDTPDTDGVDDVTPRRGRRRGRADPRRSLRVRLPRDPRRASSTTTRSQARITSSIVVLDEHHGIRRAGMDHPGQLGGLTVGQPVGELEGAADPALDERPCQRDALADRMGSDWAACAA